MDSTRRDELEIRLRKAVKEHQQEGLHLIGGTDELIARLLNTVEEWEQGLPLQARKTA
ncbi:MAG TPA: hypothetical protein VN669_03460 [Candidatus Acidoferrales bacterium]|jgi:hypothetical protein|nr:hypothetical protein [Candidatus Acidoferrales bacterium]